MTDPDLDTLFAAARDDRPLPSAGLMARVMADAVAHQPRVVLHARTAPAPVGWLDWLAALFGGGGALAGVSLAMVAGVFIGVMQPEPVAALTSLLVTTQTGTVDLFPADAALWEDQTNE